MLHNYKIVVIEDEDKIALMIKKHLENEGAVVFRAEGGAGGLALVKQHSPDLVLLDLMLPDMDGLEVCHLLRQEEGVPIIMLTARSLEVNRVVGLEMGADDYITKPFSLAELSARIRAVLRRTNVGGSLQQNNEKVINRGELHLDIESHNARKGNIKLELTLTEFKILTLLTRYPGRVFSRLQLLEACLGDAYSGYERSIDTHISNLRKKIEDDPANPSYIITVFGLGYKFDRK